MKFIMILLLPNFALGFNLFLDIGHTPSAYGAISSTCKKEYSYNVDLALSLKTILTANSDIHVATRDVGESTFNERYLQSSGQDLFVSLHHDSVQQTDLSHSHGCPTAGCASGFSIFVSKKNPYYKQSLIYAKRFANQLIKNGLKPISNHLKQTHKKDREVIDPFLGIFDMDDLKVLKHAKSPAFLFEAGVIVNPLDENRVKSEYFKKIIAKSLKKCVQEN